LRDFTKCYYKASLCRQDEATYIVWCAPQTIDTMLTVTWCCSECFCAIRTQLWNSWDS